MPFLGAATRPSASGSCRSADAACGIADTLNSYNQFVGDPGYFDRDLERYVAVTRSSLQQASARYLSSARHVTLSIVPNGRIELAVPQSVPAVVQ